MQLDRFVKFLGRESILERNEIVPYYSVLEPNIKHELRICLRSKNLIQKIKSYISISNYSSMNLYTYPNIVAMELHMI